MSALRRPKRIRVELDGEGDYDLIEDEEEEEEDEMPAPKRRRISSPPQTPEPEEEEGEAAVATALREVVITMTFGNILDVEDVLAVGEACPGIRVHVRDFLLGAHRHGDVLLSAMMRGCSNMFDELWETIPSYTLRVWQTMPGVRDAIQHAFVLNLERGNVEMCARMHDKGLRNCKKIKFIGVPRIWYHTRTRDLLALPDDLYRCCATDSLECIKWLEWLAPFDRDVIVDTSSTYFETCCQTGSARAFTHLLEKFKPGVARMKMNHMLSLACAGGSEEIVKTIAERFQVTDEDARDANCDALRNACARGHQTVAKYLYERFNFSKEDARSLGAVTTEKNHKQNYALRMACAGGHCGVVKWLFKEVGLTEKDLSQASWFAFCGACCSGNLKLVKWLVHRFDLVQRFCLKSNSRALLKVRETMRSGPMFRYMGERPFADVKKSDLRAVEAWLRDKGFTPAYVPVLKEDLVLPQNVRWAGDHDDDEYATPVSPISYDDDKETFHNY
jgi:hypothetical protein